MKRIFTLSSFILSGMILSGNHVEASTYTNDPVNIQIEAEDDESGVRSLEMPDGSMIMYGTNTQGESRVSREFQVVENGNYIFSAEDVATNRTETNQSVGHIDNENPEVEIHGNPTSWTNESVTLEAAFDGGWSGLAGIQLPDNTYHGIQNLVPQDISMYEQGGIHGANGHFSIPGDPIHDGLVRVDHLLPINDADSFTIQINDPYRVNINFYETDEIESHMGVELRVLRLETGDVLEVPEGANYFSLHISGRYGNTSWGDGVPESENMSMDELTDELLTSLVITPNNSRQFFDIDKHLSEMIRNPHSVRYGPHIEDMKPNTHYTVKTTIPRGTRSSEEQNLYDVFLNRVGEEPSTREHGFGNVSQAQDRIQTGDDATLDIGVRSSYTDDVANGTHFVKVFEAPILEYDVHENGEYRFRAWDMAGNHTDHIEYVTMIDKNPPQDNRIEVGKSEINLGPNVIDWNGILENVTNQYEHASGRLDHIRGVRLTRGVSPTESGVVDSEHGKALRIITNGQESYVNTPGRTDILTGVVGASWFDMERDTRFDYDEWDYGNGPIRREYHLEDGARYEFSAWVLNNTPHTIWLGVNGRNIDNSTSFITERGEWELLRMRFTHEGEYENNFPRVYLSGQNFEPGLEFIIAQPELREVLD